MDIVNTVNPKIERMAVAADAKNLPHYFSIREIINYADLIGRSNGVKKETKIGIYRPGNGISINEQ